MVFSVIVLLAPEPPIQYAFQLEDLCGFSFFSFISYCVFVFCGVWMMICCSCSLVIGILFVDNNLLPLLLLLLCFFAFLQSIVFRLMYILFCFVFVVRPFWGLFAHRILFCIMSSKWHDLLIYFTSQRNVAIIIIIFSLFVVLRCFFLPIPRSLIIIICPICSMPRSVDFRYLLIASCTLFMQFYFSYRTKLRIRDR